MKFDLPEAFDPTMMLKGRSSDFQLVEALVVLDCELGDRHRISPVAGVTLAVRR